MLGPSLDYSVVPDLVGNRDGSGPVWIAWDTNVLILYQQCGPQLWEGEDLPAVRVDPKEVEALGELVAIWMWWDLRFMPLELSASDYLKPRPEAEMAAREWAIRGIADALSLGLDGEPESEPVRSSELPDDISAKFPEGHDRMLVREAFARGADVCMTMDRKVFNTDALVAPLGMRCLKPSAVLAALRSAGVNGGWSPSQLSGLAPDLGRMSALIGALDGARE